MVLVEYVGAKQGKTTVRGRATGQAYRFAATPDDRLHYVFRADAEYLLTLPEYRLKEVEQPAQPAAGPAIVKAAALGPSMARAREGGLIDAKGREALDRSAIMGSPQRPTRESGRAKAAPEDDLTQIRGISKRRAEALGAFGICRFRDLVVYTAPELLEAAKQAGLKGVLTEEMMGNWLMQAREEVARQTGNIVQLTRREA